MQIKITSQLERAIILSLLESLGYRWRSGSVATKYIPSDLPCYLNVNSISHRLTFGEKRFGREELTVLDIIKNHIKNKNEMVEHTQIECGIPYAIVKHSCSEWIGTQVIKNVHDNKTYWSVYNNPPHIYGRPLIFDNPTKFKKVKER